MNTPDPGPPPEYLTVVQAAAWIGLSERTIRRLIADGTLPVYRFGGAVRIKRSTLGAWAEAQENAPRRPGGLRG